MRERLQRLTGGASPTPLMVLFGLNFVDEFDRIAFAWLTPEIRDSFALTDAQIGALSVTAGGLILMAALPMGVLADRFSRVRIGVGAALLWGTMSLMTGIVPSVILLFLVRLLAGIGRTANEIVHPSLLTDYYDKSVIARVFQVHRLANPLSAVGGIAAGAVASATSWQVAFIVLSIPTFLLLVAASRLREPSRGESVDQELAQELEEADSVPFGEARRQLFSVKSLRRIWTGSLFNGAAIVAAPQLIALFFEDVYAFGSFDRGLVAFLFGLGIVGGIVVGGALAERAMIAGNPPRLAAIAGVSGVISGAGILLLALAPVAWLSVAGAVVFGFGAGSFQPGYYPLVGLVAPPRVRSQAYAWAIIFLTFGAFGSIILFSIGDTSGYRTAMAIMAVMLMIGGAIATTAKNFVSADIKNAEGTLATVIELRRSLADTGEQALLVCRGVEVAYGQVQVLFGVDIEVRHGEIVALLGTNGAGKSTLLKAISGLVDPIGGAIFFEGRDITHADARQTVTQGVVQVPGGHAIFPTVTVAEHLRLAAWLDDDTARVKQNTQRALDTFPRLKERIDQPAGNLSGGEQQMLAIGMALIGRPKLLVIDELSLGLAPTIVADLLEVVRDIRDAGTAVVVVEQSINVALTLADRAYFMEKGEVRFDGPTEELLGRDDILRSVFLEGADLGGGDAAASSTVELSEVVAPSEPAPAIGKPVLVVENIRKRYGGVLAVDDAHLTVHENEIVGIVGANGAGKTTLFDIISGFVTPDQGRIELDGVDLTGLTADARAWAGLGRSFQAARLVPALSVAENMAIGLERHLEYRDHLASALRLPGVVRLEEDVAWTVADLIEMLGLRAYRDKRVGELSTGTRRVVDLGMVIAHDPTVLLLDEPSSGIAQRETEALVPLLKDIQRETGCAIVLIEHDMPLITGVSDRLYAMDLGRTITSGTPEEVINNPLVVSAYLGSDEATIHRSGTTEGVA